MSTEFLNRFLISIVMISDENSTFSHSSPFVSHFKKDTAFL